MVREDRDLERSALVLQPLSLGGSSPSADAALSRDMCTQTRASTRAGPDSHAAWDSHLSTFTTSPLASFLEFP